MKNVNWTVWMGLATFTLACSASTFAQEAKTDLEPQAASQPVRKIKEKKEEKAAVSAYSKLGWNIGLAGAHQNNHAGLQLENEFAVAAPGKKPFLVGNLNVGNIGDKIVGKFDFTARGGFGPVFFTYTPGCIEVDSFMTEFTIGLHKLGIGLTVADINSDRYAFEVSTGLLMSRIMSNNDPLRGTGDAHSTGLFIELGVAPAQWLNFLFELQRAQVTQDDSVWYTGDLKTPSYNRASVKVECRASDQIKFYSEYQFRSLGGEFAKSVWVNGDHARAVETVNNSMSTFKVGVSYNLSPLPQPLPATGDTMNPSK